MTVWKVIDRKDGAAAVEFALVLPILLLILFAVIEYGWYLTHQVVLANAVAEGCRRAVQVKHWEFDDPKTEVKDEAMKGVVEAYWLIKEDELDTFKSDNIYVDPQLDDDPKTVAVAVQDYAFRPITGFMPEALVPRTLFAKSTMTFP